jgi:hypothetical protein
MKNYICTFTDNNCIENILKVWLPTLQQNFSGNIVVITFQVNQEYIDQLRSKNVIVIEEDITISGLFKTIEHRLRVQEKFINTLEDDDKIMLIDGADVVFQSNIDGFFDRIKDKIFYSTTGTLSNAITVKWLNKFTKKLYNWPEREDFFEKLKSTEIIASGMLAGRTENFKEYFNLHKKAMQYFEADYFTGINQAILTYLIITQPEKFEKTDIHNCRILSENVIKENGIYKLNKVIPIIHFSCERQKEEYITSFLQPSSTIIQSQEFSNKIKPLKILWLYGSVPKFDEINHWYHTDFARLIANMPNIELMLYGYKMEELHPDIAKIKFDSNKTGLDVKKEFDFDIIIMDNKNRFAYSQTLAERKAKKLRTFWLTPEFFKGLDNVPKIFLEGDYHLHFHAHPEEIDWYKDRKIDLLLVRHLSALDYHKDTSIPIQWFPCSVDDNIFKPNPDIQRKNKICLISGYGTNYYLYRNTAGKILQEQNNMIDVYNKRFLGKEYIKNLQSYICHLSGSSIRAITPAKMFEIMSSGSVLFTDEGDEYGLKELFPDNSYVTYNKKDFSDVIEKGKKILNEPAYRKELTEKALLCIKQKHTHIIRAQELLTLISKQFNISYIVPKENINLMGKIYNLFVKAPEDIIETKIDLNTNQENTITEITKNEDTIIEKNILRTNTDNENIIRKLIKNDVKVCILKDTCYNVLINDRIGEKLYIAVDDKIKAKKLTDDTIIFGTLPANIKKFQFQNMILYIPCPVLFYLKKEYGIIAEEELEKKEKILRLFKKEYKFCSRPKQRKRR